MEGMHPYLRPRREELNLTMQQVAVLAEVSLATVYRAEVGLHMPQRATAERLAKALNLPVEKVLEPAGA